MQYRRKFIIYVSIIAALAVVYTLSWVFDAEHLEARGTRFSLLDENDVTAVSRIEIKKASESVTLTKAKSDWVLEGDGVLYPVKSERVSDLLKALSQSDNYPKVASSEKAHIDLGLDENSADRIKVLSDQAVFCDILLGKNDAEGNGRFFRRNTEASAFRGNDSFTYFISEGARGWYNLALFPLALDGANIQRLSVKANLELEEGTPIVLDYILARDAQRGWILLGNETLLIDSARADSLANAFADISGDNFLSDQDDFNAEDAGASLIADDGAGRQWTLYLDKELGDDSPIRAKVANQDFIYSIALWNAKRLLVSETELEKTN